MDIHGLAKGLYLVKAREIETPFVAQWNGHKWRYKAAKYNINIYDWIKL